MAIKPILFNTPMVKAILDGKKTVTRRIANINTDIPCRDSKDHSFVWDNFGGGEATGFVCKRCGFGVSPPHSRYPCGTSVFRPRYVPGDILYVRETWQYAYDMDGNENIDYESGRYLYAADNPAPFNCWIMPDGSERDTMPWRPSIHMPKEAARIFLRVTSVRVERLQDITDEQCMREGIQQWSKDGKLYKYAPADSEGDYPMWSWQDTPIAPRGAYVKLWDSTVPKSKLPQCGFAANPWVWVYKFERCANPFSGTEVPG